MINTMLIAALFLGVPSESAQPPENAIPPLQRVHAAANELATGILDAIVEEAGREGGANLDALRDWTDLLTAPSHGLPPDIVMNVFRNRYDLFSIVSRDDPAGPAVLDLVLEVMLASHRRASGESERIRAESLDRWPPPPEFIARMGGAVKGDGRVLVHVDPGTLDEVQLRAYEAWRAEEQRVEALQRRERLLAQRLRTVEIRFRIMARSLFFHANEAERARMIRRLRAWSHDDGTDYIALAGLAIDAEPHPEG